MSLSVCCRSSRGWRSATSVSVTIPRGCSGKRTMKTYCKAVCINPVILVELITVFAIALLAGCMKQENGPPEVICTQVDIIGHASRSYRNEALCREEDRETGERSLKGRAADDALTQCFNFCLPTFPRCRNKLDPDLEELEGRATLSECLPASPSLPGDPGVMYRTATTPGPTPTDPPTPNFAKCKCVVVPGLN